MEESLAQTLCHLHQLRYQCTPLRPGNGGTPGPDTLLSTSTTPPMYAAEARELETSWPGHYAIYTNYTTSKHTTEARELELPGPYTMPTMHNAEASGWRPAGLDTAPTTITTLCRYHNSLFNSHQQHQLYQHLRVINGTFFALHRSPIRSLRASSCPSLGQFTLFLSMQVEASCTEVGTGFK